MTEEELAQQQEVDEDEDLSSLDDGSNFDPDKLAVDDDDKSSEGDTKQAAADDADDADDADEEPEKKAAADDDDDVDDDDDEEDRPQSKDNRMVPRSRLNQKIQEAKRLKLENEELRRAAAERQPDKNGKEDDGKDVEAELRAELRKASIARKKAIEKDDDEATADADEKIADISTQIVQARLGKDAPAIDQDEVTAAAVDQMEWKQGLKEVYKKFPMLNSNDKKTADTALIQETLDMQEALMSRGQGKAESLQNAVHYVMGAAGIQPEGEVKPSLEKKTGKKRSTAAAAAKKAPDISKAGDAGKGDDDADISLADISDEELEALPESRLKKMRGDYLE